MSGQTDQSRAVSRVSAVEALTQIRALCDGFEADGWGDAVSATAIRAVLDAVSVDATPPQGIDRAALERLILEARYSRGNRWTTEKFADAIEALVRPVEGIVLSPGEARLAEHALREYGAEPSALDYTDMAAMDTLASRLEALS